MSDNRKEAEEKMAKAIFISADCWLSVYDLLPPSQLGLGIALISHRFDFYVDEHFKTRKWALKYIEIRSKIGENGTKEMDIVNCNGERMPIPEIQIPRKVIGFKCIEINFIDQNVIAFFRRFGPLSATFPIHLIINTNTDRILEFFLRSIWPMIGKNICGMDLFSSVFQSLRELVPSILNDCPSLHYANFNFYNLFAEFPADDSAMASDGQWVAKWLFTPHPNNVPKMFPCWLDNDDGNWPSRITAFKAAFANASSPANFIVVIRFIQSPFADSVVPFDQTNEFTREQLALKRTVLDECFLLVRCPIARDESKWTKWEKEAIGFRIDDQWNRIEIQMDDNYMEDEGASRRNSWPM